MQTQKSLIKTSHTCSKEHAKFLYVLIFSYNKKENLKLTKNILSHKNKLKNYYTIYLSNYTSQQV